MKAFLPKDNLVPLLTRVGGYMEVVAPIEVEGVPVFASWSGEFLALKDNPLVSPLEFFLPQRETLFRYVQDSGRYSFEAPLGKVRLVFGIRPCDLRALTVLDSIFGSQPMDQLYFDKRRSTVLVALNCSQPGEGCFCEHLGSGPQCSDAVDLQLTEIADGYVIETGSPAGILIMKAHPEFFLEARRSHLLEKDELMKQAKEAMKDRIPRSLPEIKRP